MINIESDCHTCTPETGRYPGCHGTCERYKKFKQEVEKIRMEKEKDKFNRTVGWSGYKRRRK